MYLGFTRALRSFLWTLTFLWHSLSKLIKTLHSSVCRCGDKSGCIFRRWRVTACNLRTQRHVEFTWRHWRMPSKTVFMRTCNDPSQKRMLTINQLWNLREITKLGLLLPYPYPVTWQPSSLHWACQSRRRERRALSTAPPGEAACLHQQAWRPTPPHFPQTHRHSLCSDESLPITRNACILLKCILLWGYQPVSH